MSRMAKLKEQLRQKAQSEVQAKPVFKEQPIVEPVAKPELPDGWAATDRVVRGRPVFVAYAICVAKKTKNIVRETLKRLRSLDKSTFIVGKVCPTCHGTGYIPEFGHVAGGICYKCNDPTTTGGGKGWISAQDKAYNDARIKAGTLCDVVAA